MVESISLFKCELCENVYKDYEKAARCEKEHIGVSKIISSDKYLTKYPSEISCLMEDGETVIYRFTFGAGYNKK